MLEKYCGICKLDFKCIKDVNAHMDMKHQGLGKMNDLNVLRDVGPNEYKKKMVKMGEIIQVYLQGEDC